MGRKLYAEVGDEVLGAANELRAVGTNGEKRPEIGDKNLSVVKQFIINVLS
jgi:hypothetical protein